MTPKSIIKAILKVCAFIVGIIALFLFLGYFFFYGSAFVLGSFTVGSIAEVFLFDVLFRYFLFFALLFIILRLFGTLITSFRKWKIILPILFILSVVMFFLEKPIYYWIVVDSASQGFINREYSCTGGANWTGGNCSVIFDISNPVDQSISIIASRLESSGYKSVKMISLPPLEADNWTSINDPLIIEKIKQGGEFHDAFSKSENESGIGFSAKRSFRDLDGVAVTLSIPR